MVTRLIIDDEKTFTKLDPEGVEYVRSCREGLARIKENGMFWDEIWLDYDLGDSDANPIIDYLDEVGGYLGVQPPTTKIVTCSMNPVGRNLIKIALEKWYHVVEIQPWEYL